MNRESYHDYIKDKLLYLSFKIIQNGKLNLLNSHKHSENFYCHFFNKLFDYKLYNLNLFKQNVEGIDLIDDENKIVIQVSATGTKKKIQDSLEKDLSKYSNYRFKFICICNFAKHAKINKFNNPHNLIFNQECDFHDVTSIIDYISNLTVPKIKEINKFIKEELGNQIEEEAIETELSNIIKILAKENLNFDSYGIQTKSFKIEEKIKFNKLKTSRNYVNDYKRYYGKLYEIYNTFDTEGANTSISVLGIISEEYTENLKHITDPDDLFYRILENIRKFIINSKNYNKVSEELLKYCVKIIVVDAFIRCKIFENPEDYDYVAS